MDILGIFKDHIRDRGNVEITLTYKDIETEKIRIHNSGTTEACRFLIDCLVGDFDVNRRPGAIVPCVVTEGPDGKDVYEPIFGGLYYDDMVFEVVEVNDTDNYCEAILEFNIPGDIYAGQPINGFKLYGFDRLGERKEFALARLKKEINLEPGAAENTNLNIRWHIRISVK